MKRVLCAWALALALVLMCVPALAEGAPEAGSLEGYVILLHTSDWGADGAQGLSLARVSYVRKSLEEAGAAVILVDGGNSLFASDAAEASEDALAAASRAVGLMNAAGYDALALGDNEQSAGAEALKDLTGLARFAFLNAESGQAALVLEKAGLRVGLMAAPVKSDPDTAGKTLAALRSQSCDVIVCFDRAGEGDVSALCEADGAPQIVVACDGGESLPEGQWQGETLIARAAGGLGEIGCVAVAPDFSASCMIIDESWFDETMIDRALAKQLGRP